ncbi:hypothetical protein ACWCQQ_22370 [Streptomyces sp. NPDC002143]
MVVAGLVISQAGPRFAGAAAMRRQAEAFWSLATFVLAAPGNGCAAWATAPGRSCRRADPP